MFAISDLYLTQAHFMFRMKRQRFSTPMAGWEWYVLYKMPYLSIQMGLNEIHCSLLRDGATAG